MTGGLTKQGDLNEVSMKYQNLPFKTWNTEQTFFYMVLKATSSLLSPLDL